MDRYEAQEVKEIMAVKRNECPCGEPLEYFSGLFIQPGIEYIPAYLYCPRCMAWAYDEDGERIGRLE